ncbi:MAG: RloB domain-containing protein [Magnetococcales bacterium]|nr:RloB domain-containing protein [Magnetococcales bacterium]
MSDGNEIILIITEDTHSGLDYLQSLIDHLGLKHRVEAISSDHPDPGNVIDSAIRVAKVRNRDVRIDRIFCLFDGDTFLRGGQESRNARNALQKGIRQKTTTGNPWQVLISTPCFEVFLLLHFQEMPGPVSLTKVSGRESWCLGVERMLSNVLQGEAGQKGYDKGQSLPFHLFRDKVRLAADRARRDEDSRRASGDPIVFFNPSTMVHHLIDVLLAERSGGARLPP